MSDREAFGAARDDDQAEKDLRDAATWWDAVKLVLGFTKDEDQEPADRGGWKVNLWPLAFTVAGAGAVASVAGTEGLPGRISRAIQAIGRYILEHPAASVSGLLVAGFVFVAARRFGEWAATSPLERGARWARDQASDARKKGFGGLIADLDHAIVRFFRNPLGTRRTKLATCIRALSIAISAVIDLVIALVLALGLLFVLGEGGGASVTLVALIFGLAIVSMSRR